MHKVAANFPIVAGLKVNPMTSSPKAVHWFCIDFSDDGEEPQPDGAHEKVLLMIFRLFHPIITTFVRESSECFQLSARFGTPEKAAEFAKLLNSLADRSE